MLVVTNRNPTKSFLKSGIGDDAAFEEEPNAKGSNEIRLAHAKKDDSNWVVKLVQEPQHPDKDNLPSKAEFSSLLRKCSDEKKNCLIYVHGYNKPFSETLEQGWLLQQRYNLEVVLFSWPSNTGGIPLKEYKKAKRTAMASTGALDALLERLTTYLQVPFNQDALLSCDVKLSLMTYSLGNIILQSYVEGSTYDGETRMFSNIIVCQADCDSEGHEKWIQNMHAGKRIYITINEEDKILGWSDANFQKDRLGRTARNLISKNATYFDFTDSPGMGKTHQVWGKDTNNAVRKFFNTALNGGRAESIEDFTYNQRINAFVVRP